MQRPPIVLRWMLALGLAAALPALVGLPTVPISTVEATPPYYSYPCPFIAQGRDFNGDGVDVGATWSPASGMWNTPGDGTSQAYGGWGDYPVNGDYNGDSKSDLAVWRPSTGTWYVKCSSTTACASGDIVFQFGTAGDIPVPADYDNDGFTDYAVWRPSSGFWFVMSGADRTTLLVNAQWGTYGDCPIPGRLNGSGAGPLELNVWRPSNGVWYYGRSLAGTGGAAVTWGTYGDRPFALDANLDGDEDIVVWRPSNGVWYGLAPSFTIQWGTAGDIPTVSKGNFGNQTVPTLNVWRPATRFFYGCSGAAVTGLSGTACANSGFWLFSAIGLTGDVPVGGRTH